MTTPRVSREHALVKSVHAIDTSRRVGWGKFYAEAEKVDDLSRDLNMARSDFEIMSRFAAYVYGALTIAAPEVMSKLPEAVDRLGVLKMLPERSLGAGRRAARRYPRRGRKPDQFDEETIRFIAEVISDRKEKLSNPDRRPRKFDEPVGRPYRVSEDGPGTNIEVRATAQGGVQIQRLKRNGKGMYQFYFTAPERRRLLNVLEALGRAQPEITGERR